MALHVISEPPPQSPLEEKTALDSASDSTSEISDEIAGTLQLNESPICKSTSQSQLSVGSATIVPRNQAILDYAFDDTSSSSSNLGGGAAATLFPKAATLDPKDAPQVVRLAHRRFHKSCLNLQQDEDLIHSPTSATATVTAIQHLTHDMIQLGRVLGEGSFSVVYELKAWNEQPPPPPPLTDHREVADKKYCVKFLRSELLRQPAMVAACGSDLVKEGWLLHQLQATSGDDEKASNDGYHLLEVHGWAPYGLNSFHSGYHDSFFLILEKLSGTLGERMVEWKETLDGMGVFTANKVAIKLDVFRQRLSALTQIASALDYLHSRRVCHRDLKLDKIGFAMDGSIKLFDLDVARVLPPSSLLDAEQTFALTRRVGSPRYMAPECARGEAYNAKIDTYSLGLLVHEVYTLRKPYHDIPGHQHDVRVFYQGVRPSIPDHWPSDFAVFLQRAWDGSIGNRYTMARAKEELERLVPILWHRKQRKYGVSRARLQGW